MLAGSRRPYHALVVDLSRAADAMKRRPSRSLCGPVTGGLLVTEERRIRHTATPEHDDAAARARWPLQQMPIGKK